MLFWLVIHYLKSSYMISVVIRLALCISSTFYTEPPHIEGGPFNDRHNG